jgi:hypothetical protein
MPHPFFFWDIIGYAIRGISFVFGKVGSNFFTVGNY